MFQNEYYTCIVHVQKEMLCLTYPHQDSEINYKNIALSFFCLSFLAIHEDSVISSASLCIN